VWVDEHAGAALAGADAVQSAQEGPQLVPVSAVQASGLQRLNPASQVNPHPPASQAALAFEGGVQARHWPSQATLSGAQTGATSAGEALWSTRVLPQPVASTIATESHAALRDRPDQDASNVRIRPPS
jgi:hypothetical protein